MQHWAGCSFLALSKVTVSQASAAAILIVPPHLSGMLHGQSHCILTNTPESRQGKYHIAILQSREDSGRLVP